MLSISTKVKKGTSLYKGIQLNSKGMLVVKVREGVHIHPVSGETIGMVELAKLLHFGGYNIPPRPFLEDSVRECWDEIKKVIKSSMVLRFRGLSADVQYDFAANDVAYIVKKFISSGDYYRSVEPNADYTIMLKGHDTPLVDTGQLVEHVEAVYVRLK